MVAGSGEDLARRREMKESARRLEGLVYFDLQLIAPFTRYILTEQIRLLRQIAYTRPFELPRRVIIIDHGQVFFDGALQDIIDRLATHKMMTLVRRKGFSQTDFKPYGEVLEQNANEVRLKIPRAQIVAATRDLIAALERAVRYGAYSHAAVERILSVRARPRTALESLA